jgi:hypothetical protein
MRRWRTCSSKASYSSITDLQMAADGYGEVFREAYAVLHGGRPDEIEGTSERGVGEGMEEYLARTRSEALGAIRNQLLGEEPPEDLTAAHSLLLELLANAAAADVALAAQVKAYQCGQFHESVRHSDRLQELVIESQRLDRELINTLKSIPGDRLAALGIEL